MSDELNDELESKTEPTEEVVNTEEVEEVDSNDADETEDSEDLEAIKEKNKRLYERAKKAEAEAKILKAERIKKEEKAKVESKPSEKQDGISVMDAIVLSKASVAEDDIEEVVSYAKFRNVSVKEALKDKTLQTILRDRDEQRKTAEATNTGTARRGSAQPTNEQVLANPDKYDPEQLAEARWASKKK